MLRSFKPNDTKSMELLARKDVLAVFYRGKYHVLKLERDPTKEEIKLMLESVGIKK